MQKSQKGNQVCVSGFFPIPNSFHTPCSVNIKAGFRDKTSATPAKYRIPLKMRSLITLFPSHLSVGGATQYLFTGLSIIEKIQLVKLRFYINSAIPSTSKTFGLLFPEDPLGDPLGDPFPEAPLPFALGFGLLFLRVLLATKRHLSQMY